MEYKFITQKIKYDGRQLSPHWIYKTTGAAGNAVACFIGGADVKLTEMVDLFDVKRKEGIFAKEMLHFIIEHFDVPLSEMIWRQRLFISICTDELRKNGADVKRSGDDIFSGDRKFSVSIATCSPVSSLIHTGINIDPKGAPVKAVGLKEFKIDPKRFAGSAAKKYIDECDSIKIARCKVRPV